MEPVFGPEAAEIIGLFAAPFLHESVVFIGPRPPLSDGGDR
jgi:hypothetical protein